MTAILVSALLRGIGFESIDHAADGLEAWTMLRHTPCSLIISDYRMKPMNGLMFLHAVREDEDEVLRPTRFMLITASADPALAAEAEALGADAFLVKPFTMQTLREQIAAMPRKVSALRPAA